MVAFITAPANAWLLWVAPRNNEVPGKPYRVRQRRLIGWRVWDDGNGEHIPVVISSKGTALEVYPNDPEHFLGSTVVIMDEPLEAMALEMVGYEIIQDRPVFLRANLVAQIKEAS